MYIYIYFINYMIFIKLGYYIKSKRKKFRRLFKKIKLKNNLKI